MKSYVLKQIAGAVVAALDTAAVQQAIDKQERDLKTLLKVRF